MTKSLTTDGYSNLLKRVRETLLDGQRRIDAQRVRTYWETGRINCRRAPTIDLDPLP